ncbi:MAG TPA: DUF4147 domain-containing protein [Gemmatimonadales bacterium]|nr:DUF4147 domain-containing protein [Gemmatimonadales bacterium]
MAAALEAVDAARCTRRALDRLAVRPAGPVAVVAIGKASAGMARAIVEWLASHGIAPCGGLVVGHVPTPPPHPAVPSVVGDHPIPGAGSSRAADTLAAAIAALPADATVHVAISGGTSALIGAPRSGVTPEAFAAEWRGLLDAGLPIAAMNVRRHRIARFAGGGLAEALIPRRIIGWLLSDVVGGPIDAIGSGPLVSPAVPVPMHLVGDNPAAVRAAADAATAAGCVVRIVSAPLDGEAAAAGGAIAAALLALPRADTPQVLLWGGETTVELGPSHGVGGRSQELALSASQVLAAAGDAARGVTLLAFGTDGRDGPTDAAGAIVSAGTWQHLLALGADPAEALARHDSAPMLDRADALVRTGPTGTNVADLVIGLRWPS